MPTNLLLGLGIALALVMASGLVVVSYANFSRDFAGISVESPAPPRQDGDVGPGSDYAAEHPTFLKMVTRLIKFRGGKCPVLVNLWDEPEARYGKRLEAICGPNKDHIDASLHYAVYLGSRVVIMCAPWREFGPDCR